MACAPPRATDELSRLCRRGTRGRRALPEIPAGIFYFRTQSSVSVLGGKELDARNQGSAFAGARTAFGRAFSEPYRFGHELRAGVVGNVE